MKIKKIFLLLLVSIPVGGMALSQTPDSIRMVEFQDITVTARRILQDIGTQKTVLDTFALRENVTNSLADVLSQNSSIFIKSYGRATLSTASFRGTAPSHTQVTWNGMKLNSPMLGMVDFSLIPSYFIDDATLYHGAGSVGITGGGLGGAITLSSRPVSESGIGMKYIQGVSSFRTFDEFLRFTYKRKNIQSSTRLYYASSDNDFTYTNYRKKEFIYDDNKNIMDWHYPQEKNKNGSFKDLHLLQELYWNAKRDNRFGFSAWYMNSKRGVPMLNVDYQEENLSRNEQSEQTFRSTLQWNKTTEEWRFSGNAGYTYTDLKYVYLGDLGNETLTEMIHSQSYVHTGYGKLQADYFIGDRWLFSGSLALHQHFVKSMDRAILTMQGEKTTIGYDKARSEVSGFLSARYRPTERIGLSLNLREEVYDDHWTPLIPAFFAEYLLSKKGEVTLKTSVARNYRYPTLNDLYFMPGGNDSLKTEKGYTYDIGIKGRGKNKTIDIHTEIAWFDSHIKDWIIWLPTFKGFWSPSNIKQVHSYGVEVKGGVTASLGASFYLKADGNYTLTNSINQGDPVNWSDQSIGKQLVYIPRHSSAILSKVGWKQWELTYKWNYYSKRYTTSSNETVTRLGEVGAYYMNDISLERQFPLKWASLAVKLVVNNLFNEEYESVLSRPMAGRNYGIFIEITPRFKKVKSEK